MPKLKTICYAARLVHRECLEVLFNRTEVASVIIAGPELTPLPFLADPREYARTFNVAPLDSEDVSREQLTGLASQTDVGISLGCRRILRSKELGAPRFGTFNLHPSALPRYRGLHPDLYALMDGKRCVGMTLHRMETGIDAGPIVGQHTAIVEAADTIVMVTDRLYSQGAGLLESLLDQLAANARVAECPQPKDFDPLENRRIINWRDSAWRINNLVRALTFPWPMARASIGGRPVLISKAQVVEDGLIEPGLVLRILEDRIQVGTGGNSIEIQEVRGEDREIIPVGQFISDFSLLPGNTRFDID